MILKCELGINKRKPNLSIQKNTYYANVFVLEYAKLKDTDL